MPAPAMFSKFKHVGSASAQQNILENNPISQFFEVGKQTASAGPELVWKIHDAYRKSDGKRGHSTERDVGRRLFGERWKIHLWCQPRGTKREEEQKITGKDFAAAKLQLLERYKKSDVLQLTYVFTSRRANNSRLLNKTQF
ncbi:hypothetical protein RUM44_009563 [Polyplax serrata]|uniref:Uncharacterized protein n=1 Tax=Polyplax serrata TaxID=468196 RepID=A0ABR1AT54_POLSC